MLQFMNPNRLPLPLPRSHDPHDGAQNTDQNHAHGCNEQLPKHVYPCSRGAGKELEEIVDLVEIFLMLDIILCFSMPGLSCALCLLLLLFSVLVMFILLLVVAVVVVAVVVVRLTHTSGLVVIVGRRRLGFCALLHHVSVGRFLSLLNQLAGFFCRVVDGPRLIVVVLAVASAGLIAVAVVVVVVFRGGDRFQSEDRNKMHWRGLVEGYEPDAEDLGGADVCCVC